jgi:hypothetical protein
MLGIEERESLAPFPVAAAPMSCDTGGQMHSHYDWGLIVLSAIKFLKVFGFIPGAVAAFAIRRFVQKRLQRKAMEGWPAADARIHGGNVHHEGRRFWAEITYSYYVGEYRSGTYVRGFKREEQADDFARQLKDKTVRVHYKEADPDRSVLLDRDIELIVLLAPQYS